MIQTRDLYYHYPEYQDSHVLQGVTVSLAAGETVACMGCNGSGKTTLARCLNGLLSPVSGQIMLDDLIIQSDADRHTLRRQVGLVFQNPDDQIVATTVEREIAFGLENIGLPLEEMKIRVSDAIKRFHLESYRAWPPHLLSGGERQRLALAAVWVMRPRYLILDEPTSLLDPRGREEIFQYLNEEKEHRETGILLVTQYPDEAMLADRLIIMDQGKIVLNGPPADVFRNDKQIRNFGLDVPAEVTINQWIQQVQI